MTDRIKGIAETLLTAVGVLGGLRFVKAVLYRRAERRKSDAEAYSIELQVLRQQYDWLQKKYAVINDKVDDLYVRLHRLERENLALEREKGSLELQLKEAKAHECQFLDDCRYPLRKKR